MAGGEKRKKHHDKDKYYRLAKEQGYRSRAAFKLTQINRKFHFLENAKIVIDLCAAPGGWTQVASRTMSTKGGETILLAVDILPMRAIPNVITLIGDITTEKTKSHIKAQLQTASADVVLCDGAPNVGASYDRDAYQQNEIALHAMKCATQHLKRNGTFVTKLYRSSDYISYVWVAKQLFSKVQAVKPSASRSQSAEIFLVCTGYLDPTSIDQQLLDPKTVFEQIDGGATGGGDISQNQGDAGVTIFHKKFGEKKKNRQGYDMSQLDATMRNIDSISHFIESSGSGARLADDGKKDDGKKDPIQMLSFCTGLSFTCHLCKEKEALARMPDGAKAAENIPTCNCKFYLEHRLTTSEIKACVSDLKVLNKNDFKGLLTWRSKMQDALKESQEDSGSSDDDDNEMSAALANEEDQDSDAEEEGIQAEIEQLRHKKMREAKRVKKKEREVMAKRRRRAALGMDLNAIELPENDKIFTLAQITSRGDLEAAREVDLNKVTDEQLLNTGEDEDKDDDNVVRDKDGRVVAQGEEDDIDEDTGYSYRLDRELDGAYDLYLANTKSESVKKGSRMAKRSKKAMRTKADEQVKEDQDMMENDTKAYAKILQGPRDSDDDSSDDESSDDDDGFHADPITPQEHGRRQNEIMEERNPLIHTLPSEPTSVKTARWFSNPLFESIGTTASLASIPGRKEHFASKPQDVDDYDSDEMEHLEHIGSEDEGPPSRDKAPKKRRKDKEATPTAEPERALTADDVLDMMPKTDKQIRHEKRLKANERTERKLNRRAKAAGEPEGGFEVVAGDDDEDAEGSGEKLDKLSPEGKKKVLEARSLIKAGLGRGSRARETSGFEVVSASDSKMSNSLLPIMDHRKYNSDNEDYDSDDYAQTLALGTMMLRKSKEKAFVDASYNRFAWNDPEGLPNWFLDDENKNYRPQLPITPALIAKMKERFLSIATRPIAKVAEARARKNKRSKLKLTAAKKKADAVANSSEMSEAMKLKAISKAMRGNDSSRPEKTYVVSRKGGGNQGGKGIKLVDKRMMSDKRGMKRAESRSKGGGKKGGLTGSKRRRQHS